MSPYPDHRQRRLNGLLNKALKHPRSVVRDRRTRKARFCLPFFDRCDAIAYLEPRRGPELAAAAVEIARRSGDRHLANRALGVEVNAAIAGSDWPRADRALELHERAAADCCPACLADHLHRRADLALEYRRVGDATLCLDELSQLGDHAGAAAAGRAANLRGVAAWYRGERGAAVAAVGQVLRAMPLTVPQFFFRDAIGFLGCFLLGADRRLDREALDHLLCFKERLKGTVGWNILRARHVWLLGSVYARLGNEPRAAELLDSARLALMKELGVPLVGGRQRQARRAVAEAPPPPTTDRTSRELLAVTSDLGQLSCRDDEACTAGAMLATCGRALRLDPQLDKIFGETEKGVASRPWNTLDHLARLRSSVLVPIPGLLTDCYLGTERARVRSHGRRRPPSTTVPSFTPPPGRPSTSRAA